MISTVFGLRVFFYKSSKGLIAWVSPRENGCNLARATIRSVPPVYQLWWYYGFSTLCRCHFPEKESYRVRPRLFWLSLLYPSSYALFERSIFRLGNYERSWLNKRQRSGRSSCAMPRFEHTHYLTWYMYEIFTRKENYSYMWNLYTSYLYKACCL